MSDWIGDENWWDPFLLSTCRQHVRQEHYDDVIRKAFICVEERIRECADVGTSDKGNYGTALVRRAFNKDQADFARRLLRKGVRLESARFFINGAFGLFRNEPAHRFVGHDRETCITVLRTVNWILGLVEQGRATIDDLWYAVQNPEAVIEPDTALTKLLDKDPVILRDLLMLRGQSSEDERQQVKEVIDNTLQDYLQTLRWERGKRQLLNAFKESLLQMLNDEDVYVRKGAVFYLQFFPGDDVRRRLCRILSQEELTVDVIDTLAVLGGSVGRKDIAELLVQASTPGIRRAAIEALGQMGYASNVITVLLDVFDGLHWPDKRQAIITFRKLEAREATPTLLSCLDEESWSVQIEACTTLREFSEPRAAQPLGELLMSATRSDVRQSAARALANIRTDTSFSYLKRCQETETSKDEPDKTLLRIVGEALRVSR